MLFRSRRATSMNKQTMNKRMMQQQTMSEQMMHAEQTMIKQISKIKRCNLGNDENDADTSETSNPDREGVDGHSEGATSDVISHHKNTVAKRVTKCCDLPPEIMSIWSFKRKRYPDGTLKPIFGGDSNYQPLTIFSHKPMNHSFDLWQRQMEIHKPTKQLAQDALLSVNLSIQLCGLCHDKNSERVMFSYQGQNNEIVLIHQILNHPIGKCQNKEVS